MYQQVGIRIASQLIFGLDSYLNPKKMFIVKELKAKNKDNVPYLNLENFVVNSDLGRKQFLTQQCRLKSKITVIWTKSANESEKIMIL